MNEAAERSGVLLGDIVAQKLARHGFVGLHVGSGKNRIFDDFVNVDLDGGDCYLDATKPFKLESNSVDYVYTEHFIEHLKFSQGEFFIKECFRVLKPGGIKRALFPDLKKLVNLALSDDPLNEEIQKRAVHGLKNEAGEYIVSPKATPLQGENWDKLDDIIYNFTNYWGHEYLWSAQHFKKVIEYIGFDRACICDYGIGSDPRVIKDPEVRWGREWTSVVEAVK